MRPLRLLLDGFGCYREPAEADFSDLEFFALIGPTGAGKSTVIDGLCFALYGTVPRWGKENVIALALAPAANACRVCLVFESAGKRYGVVRALARTSRGAVQTREARLEVLDPAIAPDAPLSDLLAASVEHVAEGPDEVKAAVQEILGLTYDHFTQSVLLPQGKFSEFLHAKAAQRQDLLVELLAFGVYDKVRELARRRADLAGERVRTAQSARAELAGATGDAEATAAARVDELAGLAGAVDERLESLAGLRQQAEAAAGRAALADESAVKLAAVQVPGDVPGLASRIARADELVAERKKRRDDADAAEAHAQRARDALPDRTSMELLKQAYDRRRDLAAVLRQREQTDEASKRELAAATARLDGARERTALASAALAQANRMHAAADLAQHLHVGEDCPVCRQTVLALPHHPAPADLASANDVLRAAERELGQEQAAQLKAAGLAAAAATAVEQTRGQLETVSGAIAGASDEADVIAAIEAIALADEALAGARVRAQAERAAVAAAEGDRAALTDDERRAWAGLSSARDSVIGLGAPAVASADLAPAWAELAGWAAEQFERLRAGRPAIDAAAASAVAEVTSAETALTALLAGAGITDVGDLTRAAAHLAAHQERAAGDLARIRADRARAAVLDGQIAGHRAEQEVATELGRLLRATSFERWLCGEALDSLVAEASETLMELSGGQYQLDRDERNDLVVIDFADAAARRPVHTLSGGETFQASLALALALSKQVVGLSAGMREMNSMFLDEGFGTLDEDTLETVGSTLERLAADSDRMIGIITHVPALAGRAPARFVVERSGSTATLRKEKDL